MLSDDGTVSRRWLVGGAAALVIVLLALVAVRLLGGDAADDGPRPDQAQPGTVLLVPGYGGNRTGLTRLAERLEAERLETGRRTAQVLTLPGDGTGDFETQAQVLDDAVRAALRDGSPSVDIVGYSAGGVVTRLWVDEYQGAEVARRVVTLGSPLHGTKLAGVGAAFAPNSCPAACRELAPGSDLLDSIDHALPARLPWLSIWTENDETVQPPDSARLDGAVNLSLQSICPAVRVTHSELPTDPYVTALVLTALGTGSLAAPDTCPRAASPA